MSEKKRGRSASCSASTPNSSLRATDVHTTTRNRTRTASVLARSPSPSLSCRLSARSPCSPNVRWLLFLFGRVCLSLRRTRSCEEASPKQALARAVRSRSQALFPLPSQRQAPRRAGASLTGRAPAPQAVGSGLGLGSAVAVTPPTLRGTVQAPRRGSFSAAARSRPASAWAPNAAMIFAWREREDGREVWGHLREFEWRSVAVLQTDCHCRRVGVKRLHKKKKSAWRLHLGSELCCASQVRARNRKSQ
jgi:hypothetical protein